MYRGYQPWDPGHNMPIYQKCTLAYDRWQALQPPTRPDYSPAVRDEMHPIPTLMCCTHHRQLPPSVRGKKRALDNNDQHHPWSKKYCRLKTIKWLLLIDSLDDHKRYTNKDTKKGLKYYRNQAEENSQIILNINSILQNAFLYYQLTKRILVQISTRSRIYAF